MGKRTGLGDNPLNWIADTSSSKETAIKESPKSKSEDELIERAEKGLNEVQKSITSELSNLETSVVPKFKSFEVKLSILLREDQLEFLEKLTREIMSKRDSNNKKERITKNTILRACVDVLRKLDIDKVNISDEKELLKRIQDRITCEQIQDV
jgi:Mg2+ and Co2+ transporter CorA